MASKKDTGTFIASADTTRVQHLLEKRSEIAEELHASTSRGQAESALALISSADEATQMALLKALSKQRDVDAADVLLAINELTPNKAVRKESRRALIQLAGARVYPSWTPEPEAAQTLVAVERPPRFWKGMVTRMREQGEVELVLCWEQGFEYGEARMMAFLLDFWRDGVKDFFTEVGSKRRIDARIRDTRALSTETGSEVKVSDCTLAEARRLIQEALSVNRWRGTSPHKDYRHYLPTVQQLVLNAGDVGEDLGRTFISPDLAPDEVIANFTGAWTMGDYGLCYDLLASTSSIREGLSRDEWMNQRREWANEAHPARFSPSVLREREHNQKALWLPNSVLSSRASTQREVEMCWSLELVATPLSGTLPEMPLGTAVYKGTGRHWFWTSYTLVQEEGEWRISRMTDEGASVQALPITELQQRLKETGDRVEEIMQEHSPTDPDAQQYLEEIVRLTIQAMHYDDALLVKLPFDRTLYENAYTRAMSIRSTERALVYAEAIADRFPNYALHGEDLRRLGATQITLANQFVQAGMEERAERFFALAEETIRDSLVADESAEGYLLLTELLIGRGAVDEAEAELAKARPLVINRDEEAQIEFDLGAIAIEREQFAEAVTHYERVAEMRPDYPGIWFNIGHAYRLLKNYPEAETYYKRAIQVQPDEIRAYSELAAIYMDSQRLPEAREITEQGIQANPDSAHLRGLLAGVLLDMGERRRAQKVLEEAERINPDLPMVKTVRDMLNTMK